MLALLSHIWFVLAELVRAPFDALMGRDRRRYTISIGVAAPKDVTWAVASAHSVRLEGTPPIGIEAGRAVNTSHASVKDLDQLKGVIRALSRIKGVYSVDRVSAEPS